MDILFNESNYELLSHLNSVATVGKITGQPVLPKEYSFEIFCSTMALVTKGDISMNINDTEMSASGPAYITFPLNKTVRDITTSDDFECWTIQIPNVVVAEFLRRFYPFRLVSFDRLRLISTVTTGDSNTLNALSSSISAMYYALLVTGHAFYQDMAKAHTFIFLLNHADMLLKSIGYNNTGASITPTEKSIEFIHRLFQLLRDNICEHPDIGFYADRLRISKQNLANISKKHLKAPISAVIAQVRTDRAIELMKNPALSIQQISDILSFSDQAAFGKFFRKQKGMSPKQYRKESM